jgi:hypothetical protein
MILMFLRFGASMSRAIKILPSLRRKCVRMSLIWTQSGRLCLSSKCLRLAMSAELASGTSKTSRMLGSVL